MKKLIFAIVICLCYGNLPAQITGSIFPSTSSGTGNSTTTVRLTITNSSSSTYEVRIGSCPYFVSAPSWPYATINPNGSANFDMRVTFPKYNGTYSDYISIHYEEKKETGLGKSGSFSEKITVKTVNPAITTPWGFSATPGAGNSIFLSWGASTGGDGGVKHYKVYINDSNLAVPTTKSTSYTFTNLSPSIIYKVCVTAVDEKGNESQPSTVQTITTPCKYSAQLEVNSDKSSITSYYADATQKVIFKAGFRYKAEGSKKMISRIVTCPTATYPLYTRPIPPLIFRSDVQEEGIYDMQQNENYTSVNTVVDEANLIKVNIYSLTGIKVYSSENVQEFRLADLALPEGIYVIEKIYENGEITRKKIYKK